MRIRLILVAPLEKINFFLSLFGKTMYLIFILWTKESEYGKKKTKIVVQLWFTEMNSFSSNYLLKFIN